MSGFNSHNSKNEFIVAGSFDDTCATVRGRGFSCKVASGIFTITFHRKYDSLVSFTGQVMNAAQTAGEPSVPLITAHAVVDGTAGGTVTVQCIDDTGALETAFPTDAAWEFHFLAVLEEDS